ncbi:MAG: outer membrane lipoprotein-sorting protein [Myxococcota bacterium]|nr:outer membrane lipoprotein-sorting protein [Myxococcota bacterium]
MRAHMIVALAALWVAAPSSTLASDEAVGAAPSQTSASVDAVEGAEDALSPNASLSGRDIYQCVLDNRFTSYVQSSRLVSGDRAGATQESKLRMTWSSFRDEEGEPKGGVLSKSIVKYTDPFDLRYSGYLIVNNEGRPNDQFVYLNSSRRIRRVNLRREAVFGTDFTFEDIVPREIEDGDYERLPDRIHEGTPVYVVEVVPKDYTNSEYKRFRILVEKDHCVPLLTRYWDTRDLLVKELTVPFASVKEVDGIWWPYELTMTNMQLETFTTMEVEALDPNPKLQRKVFDLRRLESH